MISGSGGGPVDGGTEFTAEGVAVVLREACEAAGLDANGAELLRLGSNAVYRLASLPIIVRIARDPGVLPEMERAVAVARWLQTVDFPATRVPTGIAQPVVVRGLVVTFWESVQEREEYATVGELADLLRRLHWLEEPESLGLPYFDPMTKLSASLDGLHAVSEEDRSFLEERAAKLAKKYDRLDFVLPEVVRGAVAVLPTGDTPLHAGVRRELVATLGGGPTKLPYQPWLTPAPARASLT